MIGRDGHFRIVAAGGVHKHRRSAQRPGQGFVRGLKVLWARGIGRKESSLATVALNTLNARLTPLFVASEHGDFCSRLGQALGHSAAQYACRANHHGHFIGKIE